MNCEGFKAIAPELARQEIMETSVRNSALAHVEQCVPCRDHWDAERALSDNLRSLSRTMNSLPAPAHLEGALLAAFRDRANMVQLRREPRRWRYWAAAVAAVLLIGIAVSAWRAGVFSGTRKELQAVTPKSEPLPNPQPPQPQPIAKVSDSGTVSKTQQPKPAPRPRVKTNRETVLPSQTVPDTASAVAANSETKEVTSDFVALGYGNALDLQDGGQLVRVELPRAALARFGLLLDMDHANERVKADVLVGTDGLARAIRFVK
jgi:hypothetical protein